MSVARVLRMGDPSLVKRARPVGNEEVSSLTSLIETLWETMAAAEGVGLAAPQIGVSVQVVVFGERSDRYPNQPAIPRTVLINPVVETLGDQETSAWEGCLSLPGMRGLVDRPDKIRYRGFDQQGCEIDCTVSGFHARVVQHECDHLDGILFPMRIRDMRYFGFEQELEMIERE
ncbi:MAG: peptide deformylase [Arenicellales bacterium]|jgi:peptide deformylase|nr:peptide deformylase [Arenicellales bacterium]|tara:strand:+ start:359 stop:880 length:522 start_codon:yes stop_codon:yes gene_type:complete